MELQKRTQEAEAATKRMANEHAQKLQEMNAATAQAQVACNKLDDAELRATQAGTSVDKAHQVCANFTPPLGLSVLVRCQLQFADRAPHFDDVNFETSCQPFANSWGICSSNAVDISVIRSTR
jgi:hypothetical protein